MEQAQEHITSLSLPSFRHFIMRYGVYVSLTVLLIIAAFITPELFSRQTRYTVLRQASQLGLVAIGQTLVLLVAGLDLSVSGVIVLTSVIIAEVSAGQDSQLPQALAIALGFGILIGMGNGLLVTKRNVPPFVATLGMLVLIRGGQIAYTRGIPSGFVPDVLSQVNESIGPVPVPVVLWLGFNLLFTVILFATPYGRRIYSIGSNREAARLSGIHVDRLMISIYVLSSVMAVVAGAVLTGYIGYVDRYLGRGMDLDSIAAAVVGGAAFTGGRGNLIGTMAGVLLVQLLATMTVLLGLDIEYQLVFKGLIIVGAVALYSVAEHKV